MQKFERFIIYPLLIMALFYSFSGEQVTTTAQEVIDNLIVREISVVDDSGKETVNISSGDIIGGSIELKNLSIDRTISLNTILGIAIHGPKTYTNLNSTRLEMNYYNENDEFKPIFKIGSSDNYSGFAKIFNSYGDSLIYIGSNADGHGLINIYDKYGEDWRSYGLR